MKLHAGLLAFENWRSKTKALRTKIVLFAALAFAIFEWTRIENFVDKTQPFLPSLLIEQVLELNAAKNFEHRGFLTNLFLVDYSTSPNDIDHPFLYTHQPSGPTVLLGALFRFGVDLLHARMVYAFLTLLGGLCLFFAVWTWTESPIIGLLSFVLYSLNYDATIRYSDHFVHAFGGLNYFGSLLFYFLYLKSPRKLNLLGFVFCLTVGFLSSFLTCIPIVVAILVLHFWRHRKSELSRTLAWTTVGTCAFWAIVLFSRNCVVLGPSIAFQDFLYTLSNRIIAWPSKDVIFQFFAKHQMVLWGVGKVETHLFENWLSNAFGNPWHEFSAPLILSGLLFFGLKLDGKKLRDVLLLTLISFVCTYAWHLIFFAQGSNYAHPPVFRMFHIGLTICVFLVVRELPTALADLGRRDHPKFRRVGPIACLFAVVISAMTVIDYSKDIRRQAEALRTAEARGFEPDTFTSYARLKNIPQGAVLTNIDSLILNYFMSNLVFGGCTEQALKDLDVSGCYSSFVAAETKALAHPSFILMDQHFIPGYQSCFGACQTKLEQTLRERYTVLDESKGDWILYQISGPTPGNRSAR